MVQTINTLEATISNLETNVFYKKQTIEDLDFRSDVITKIIEQKIFK